MRGKGQGRRRREGEEWGGRNVRGSGEREGKGEEKEEGEDGLWEGGEGEGKGEGEGRTKKVYGKERLKGGREAEKERGM
jgi:hypothetical protein